MKFYLFQALWETLQVGSECLQSPYAPGINAVQKPNTRGHAGYDKAMQAE